MNPEQQLVAQYEYDDAALQVARINGEFMFLQLRKGCTTPIILRLGDFLYIVKKHSLPVPPELMEEIELTAVAYGIAGIDDKNGAQDLTYG